MKKRVLLFGICFLVCQGSKADNARLPQSMGRSDMMDVELQQEIFYLEQEFQNLLQRALNRNIEVPNVNRNDYEEAEDYADALEKAIDTLEDQLFIWKER